MTERRTAHDRELRRLRELDALPLGTLVLATSSPAPRYFLRVAGGWHAADARGRTELHAILYRELSGWPLVLRHTDLRRPVYVVAKPDELHELRELHELAVAVEVLSA